MSQDALAAWAAVTTTLLLACITAIWKVASTATLLAANVASLTERARDLATHVEAHDAWHMNRLTNGKDPK